MTSTLEHKDFSQDNRYTIRLTPEQKEWVEKTPKAAEKIRDYIDQEINAVPENSLMDIRQKMTANLTRIHQLEKDIFYRYAKENLELIQNSKYESLDLNNLDDPSEKSFGSGENRVVVPNQVTLNRGSPEFQEYEERSRRVVVAFQQQIDALLSSNKKLESMLSESSRDTRSVDIEVRGELSDMSDTMGNVRQLGVKGCQTNTMLSDKSDSKAPISTSDCTTVPTAPIISGKDENSTFSNNIKNEAVKPLGAEGVPQTTNNDNVIGASPQTPSLEEGAKILGEGFLARHLRLVKEQTRY